MPSASNIGQGELGRIAEDPLKNPKLLQEFLDRHTNLRDLLETEQSLVATMRESANRLQPLEAAFGQLPVKKRSLDEIEKKLKLAEEGNLREVVALQTKLAAERTVRETVEAIAAEYIRGWDLSSIQRGFEGTLKTAGDCTTDGESLAAIEAVKASLARSNTRVRDTRVQLNSGLKACAAELQRAAASLKASHQRMSGDAASKLADLRAKGLATDMTGLEALLRQKTAVAKEIALVEQREEELKNSRTERTRLRAQLRSIRTEMTARRKEQLKGINQNLGMTIKDYLIFMKYDDAGITSEFVLFIKEKMHGTYLQENTIETLCGRISPSDLADLALARDHKKIAAVSGISEDWSLKIVETLGYWNILFELQILAKHPKPVITVRTKSHPARDIPVHQLSDGQRYTILLTIAMLSESNIPLVIDQPEDDLDNAFIFSSIVTTLRAIKEKRQVILVTHNANIAVLGDSELILPMHRENDCGKSKHRGSIDAAATKQCVLDILEGGSDAFSRRSAMYAH